MKRYEKMSKEEMVDFIRGIKKCSDCPLGNTVGNGFCQKLPDWCLQTVGAYLNEEIELVTRVETINTKEELVEAKNELDKHCKERFGTIDGCRKCEYYNEDELQGCFINYLAEEVERGEVK